TDSTPETAGAAAETAAEAAAASAAAPRHGTLLRPMYVVTERLQGWTPLRRLLRERGPLGSPHGLDVLRLWGRQLAALLDHLHAHSLLLRDLRPGGVLASPDGTRTLDYQGRLSGDAPDLDPDIFGARGGAIAPPEAYLGRCMSGAGGDGGGSGGTELGGDGSRSDRACRAHGDDADQGEQWQCGSQTATPAWDVWTLGALLFEMAFGVPPPRPVQTDARRAAPAAAITTSNLTVPPPYECFSGIKDAQELLHKPPALTIIGGSGGSGGYQAPDLLVSALAASSLSAIVRTAGWTEPKTGAGSEGGGVGGGDCAAAATAAGAAGALCRQRWLRRHLKTKHSAGDVSWDLFCERLWRHLQIVTAVDDKGARATSGSGFGGGGSGGGGSDGIVAGDGRCSAAARLDILTASFDAHDPRRTGFLDIDTVAAVLRLDFGMMLEVAEVDMLEVCLTDESDRLGNSVSDDSGAHRIDGNSGTLRYETLVAALADHVASRGGGGCGGGGRNGGDVGGGGGRSESGRSSDEASLLLDVLGLCLSGAPEARPAPWQLLAHPFFAALSGEREEAAECAAGAYVDGGENALRTLREDVQRPLDALARSVLLFCDSDGNDCGSAESDGGSGDEGGFGAGDGIGDGNFNVGRLADLLRVLHRLVQRPAGLNGTRTDDVAAVAAVAGSAGWRLAQRAIAVDAVLSRDVLPRAVAVALRFLAHEEAAGTYGRGAPNSGGAGGFVEGDPQMTVGTRILLALRRIFEGLAWDLRRPDSPAAPYVDLILRCVTSLYMGEEGALAATYGPVGPSILRTQQSSRLPQAAAAATAAAVTPATAGQCSTARPEDTCRWSPALPGLFQELLEEIVTEAGTGSFACPYVRRYLERAAATAHRLRGTAADDSDSD
ncbi:unnamed protein product, partial [Phaeothamnion confervicola]